MNPFDALKIVEDYFNKHKNDFSNYEQSLIKQTIVTVGGSMLLKDMNQWIKENKERKNGKH